MQHDTEVPTRFKKMSYMSYDPYGRLSRDIKELLRDNHVTLTNNESSQNLPILKVVRDSLDRSTISIYKDGKAAEYQLVLTVETQVIIEKEKIYPINVRVFRTFFDNPSAALAKTTEQDLIEDEMYMEAAKQIIRKLKSVNAVN
ncbi:LPS assembly lipoprotein LptE [Gilliamella apicola]|uniref:LPS assembly lipoprotein LptE n=1 Tax=Gilliamella apicola TaxID=1196095 RepID=UPI0015E89608|nr:LPS assembly lipoprotein LptE [Gilliamella apicola]WLS90964.1 LPS assembly lipoprotein LptE [Gilliamella apicola]